MRRPKGEGSVTKLSTGKYRARIELDPMNGKRKWLSVIRDTAPEARKALRELSVSYTHLTLPTTPYV